MTSSQTKPIEHLIVDSSAFIKLSQLHTWAHHVYTIGEVVQEIRNKDSRIALSLLPYELQIDTPTDRFIKTISEFAKKTGDYPVLSQTDIKVMALTLELECRYGEAKGDNLKINCPEKIFNPKPISVTKLMKNILPHQIGFYTGKGPGNSKAPTSCDQLEESINKLEISSNPEELNIQITQNDNLAFSNKLNGNIELLTELDNIPSSKMEDIETNSIVDGNSDEETGSKTLQDQYYQSSDDSDETEGCLNPKNIDQVVFKLGGILHEPPTNLKIAVVTSDFAMQNVLMQIGLNILSIDGLLIKEVRRYALQCRSCYAIILDTASIRCKKCGYSLLIRVHAITGEGRTTYRPLSVKQFSKRGLRYPTSLPVGGRHGNASNNPRHQPRYSKKRDKVNPLDPNYVARDSPFAYNDVTSRGANIGFQIGSRRVKRNPNEVSKRGTRKNSSKRVK